MAKEYIYKCVNCGSEYTNQEILYLCPLCAKENKEGQPLKGVLKVLYPYIEIKNRLEIQPDYLIKSDYIDLLPIHTVDSFPPLLVGKTPLYTYKQEGNIPFFLHLKVESSNPTFSFKDRASALVSAFAKEKGIQTIIAASTGNAGSSLAGICASQKQKAIILVPEKAPKAKLTQVLMYGAKLIPVKGNYDDAYDLSLKLTEQKGWYNRNTAFNPLTIEGKKTVAFELFEQMDVFPDKVFVPVGDGVILAGVYKGFEDLLELSLIDKIPQIIAVQAEGSSNLIDNLIGEEHHFNSASTLADSISVDIPRNFYMARDYINRFQGLGIKVSDAEIIDASQYLANQFGLFVEPAAAAAYAGLIKYQIEDQIVKDEQIVILLTGNGLKDIDSVFKSLDFPKPIDPNSFDLDMI
ncbi:MAG: threonine synthase [Bacteroidales bacterium]|nr:threonine synthase [Bacteroidales bacterium]